MPCFSDQSLRDKVVRPVNKRQEIRNIPFDGNCNQVENGSLSKGCVVGTFKALDSVLLCSIKKQKARLSLLFHLYIVCVTYHPRQHFDVRGHFAQLTLLIHVQEEVTKDFQGSMNQDQQ